MNALTSAERAAMRNEWSLECRQVGLDHLADCFKKPAVENPADRASASATSSSRPDPDANPVEAATADVVPTPCEADKLAFLNGVGAGGVAHTGNGKFDAHLLGVRRVMMSWVPDDLALADAGLFHSVYGTEGFQGFTLPYERRDDVRALIGERAERLVWIFCVVDRLSVDNDLDSPSGAHAFRARPEMGGFDIPLDDRDWFDFITLTLGDWLEQVEGAARAANPKFEWDVGEAWKYRRGAYAEMAKIVGERVPAAKALHEAVYAREPPETRHLRQPVTPPMSEEIRKGREGMPAVEPKFP